MIFNCLFFAFLIHIVCSLSIDQPLDRRQAIAAATASVFAFPSISLADDNDFGKYELRDRKSNKNALVREDYYFMMGKNPPRLLGGPLVIDDPTFNAFGSCLTKSDGSATNSCTYVSLSQRIPAYSKYGFIIGFGSKEYKALGDVLKKCQTSNDEKDWSTAASFLTTLQGSPPPPAIDAHLKMALFASSMLTSPNYSGPSRELLVARFYVNEVDYATSEIMAAVEKRDARRALAAWEFGKDSWNSYFIIVNDKISPKVGDQFDLIA